MKVYHNTTWLYYAVIKAMLSRCEWGIIAQLEIYYISAHTFFPFHFFLSTWVSYTITLFLQELSQWFPYSWSTLWIKSHCKVIINSINHINLLTCTGSPILYHPPSALLLLVRRLAKSHSLILYYIIPCGHLNATWAARSCTWVCAELIWDRP